MPLRRSSTLNRPVEDAGVVEPINSNAEEDLDPVSERIKLRALPDPTTGSFKVVVVNEDNYNVYSIKNKSFIINRVSTCPQGF